MSSVNPNLPRVSIGFPVYNGEDYVSEALDSLLTQTFTDFELIISDNASTDRTGEICRSYAAVDPRIRYYRNAANVGPVKNFHRVFELARGEYFKWAHHDDRIAPDFLLKCVAVMETDPSVVVCYPRALMIDEKGVAVKQREYGLDTRLVQPHERFRGVLGIDLGSPPICGIMRTSVLKKTPLLAGSYASDQVLLAELALLGRFHEVPEPLLLHRDHPQRSVFVSPTRHSLAVWFDPSRAGRIIFPMWGIFFEYLSAIHRAPLSLRERFRCWVQMVKWTRYRWQDMVEDLRIAAKQAFARTTSRQKHGHVQS
jgi:glycosyltransferase involved in cell wall biosynthesis